jgi:hypothetical protein
MKHLLFVLLCFAGLAGIGMAQIAKSVYIPGDAYTAYDIPEGGSALQLNINRADTNLVISDSEILLQDSSDTVQWYRSSASQATHVYQIGTVLSSREYLHVFGHWHYLGLAGSGPLPTFNVKVAAPNVDVDNMPEETEESVGVYLFKGGARKTVAVSAVKCRGPSNQQTLSWSSARLSLWTAATGGSMLSGNSATLSADAASTYYVQGDSASGSIRDSEISVSYTSSGNTTHDKVKLTVIKVDIAAFDRVSPGKTKQVAVTTTPSPLPAGCAISLQCDTDAGNSGSATVSPSSINQTANVTVTGGAQSGLAEKDTIKLKAVFNGNVCASESFTVCAHPINIVKDANYSSLELYGFIVGLNWESDSDVVGDLNQCWFYENVVETQRDTPPFYGSQTLIGAGWMGSGHGSDKISYPANDVKNYCDGYWIVHQKYKYQCARCGSDNEIGSGLAGCHVFNCGTTNIDWAIRTSQTTLGSVDVVQDIPEDP